MENNAYLMDYITREKIKFKFITDGQISDSVEPEYTPTQIIGRSSSLLSYRSTGTRKISFSVTLVCSVFQEDAIYDQGIFQGDRLSSANLPLDVLQNAQKIYNGTVPRRVFNEVNFLRSFLFPRYLTSADTSFGRIQPPPVAFLSLGGFVKAKCVMTECGVNWRSPWILSGGEEFPLAADITLSFDMINDDPFGSSEIRLGGGLQTPPFSEK